jgi:hypothetical protein
MIITRRLCHVIQSKKWHNLPPQNLIGFYMSSVTLKAAGFTRIRAGQGKAKCTPNSNNAHTQGVYMTKKKKKEK